MAYKNNVSIRVCGRTMTLSGDESVEYITKVANYIEQKAEELRQSEGAKAMNANLISVLTSINIADDFFKEVEKRKNIEKEFSAYKQKQAKGIAAAEEKVMKEKEDLERRLKEAEQKSNDSGGSITELEDRNKKLTNELEQSKKHAEELNRKISEIENINEGLKSSVIKLNEMVIKLNSEKENLAKDLKEAETKSDENRELQNSVEKLNGDIEELSKEKEALSEKLNEAENVIYDLREEIKIKIAKINRLKSIEDKLASGRIVEVKESF